MNPGGIAGPVGAAPTRTDSTGASVAARAARTGAVVALPVSATTETAATAAAIHAAGAPLRRSRPRTAGILAQRRPRSAVSRFHTTVPRASAEAVKLVL